MAQLVAIKLRRDTAANWTSVNPILDDGEMGIETDTTLVKVGDGSTAWTSLGYLPIIENHTPSSSAEAGPKGRICFDASYLYVWTASGTAKRIALSSF